MKKISLILVILVLLNSINCTKTKKVIDWPITILFYLVNVPPAIKSCKFIATDAPTTPFFCLDYNSGFASQQDVLNDCLTVKSNSATDKTYITNVLNAVNVAAGKTVKNAGDSSCPTSDLLGKCDYTDSGKSHTAYFYKTYSDNTKADAFCKLYKSSFSASSQVLEK